MMRKHSVWNQMRRLQEEMDALFEGMINESPLPPLLSHSTADKSHTHQSQELMKAGLRPALADFTETDKEFIATVELPGADKKDIKIKAEDNYIEIKVEQRKEDKQEDQKKGIYRVERSYAGFYRSFPIPKNVDSEAVNATYKNGVLELRMPKKAQESTKKFINVE